MNEQEFTHQLRMLLSSSYSCLRTLFPERKDIQEGFAELARFARDAESSVNAEQVKASFRSLLVKIDEYDLQKKAEEASKQKPKGGAIETAHIPEDVSVQNLPTRDYPLTDADTDALKFSQEINASFARGTRHLCEGEEDGFTESLKNVEKKQFKLTQSNVQHLVQQLKSFYLAKLNEGKQLDKEKDELHSLIEAFTNTLAAFSTQNNTYSAGLKNFIVKVKESNSIQDIAKMKELLLKETAMIAEESEKMGTRIKDAEGKLSKAKKRIVKLQEELNKVREESSIDPLTKALNRGYFNRKMKEAVSAYKRYKDKTAFMMFDIDHFKKFNDTYGHQVGDKVLEIVVSLIKSKIRESDFLFRYGGEEFALLLPKTSMKDAERLAEEVRFVVERHQFKYKGEPVSVTISIGVGCFLEGDSVESIVERCDKALYGAKEAGRNCVIAAYS